MSTTTAETKYGRYRRAIRTSSIGPARRSSGQRSPSPCRCCREGPTKCAVRLTGPVNAGNWTTLHPRHQHRSGHAGDLVPRGHAERERLPADVVGADDHRVRDLESRRLGEFQHEVLGSDSDEPRKRVSQRLPRAHRPGGEPGLRRSADGTLRVHWNDIMQEVWIDSPSGWLAAVDGMSGYTMVERHAY